MANRVFIKKKAADLLIPPRPDPLQTLSVGACCNESSPCQPCAEAAKQKSTPVPIETPGLRDDAGVGPGFGHDYGAFARQMRADLDPQGAMEAFLVERIIVCAWRLQELAEEIEEDYTGQDRELARAETRAERSMLRNLAAFEKLRTRREKAWGKAAAEASKAGMTPLPLPLPPPALGPAKPKSRAPLGRPVSARKDKDKEKEKQTPPPWEDRLEMNPGVSPRSPIVKGTQITVNQVVTLVIDGWTWAEIITKYPELTEPDVRACLAYAIEEENGTVGT